jgi:hypothetical protein
MRALSTNPSGQRKRCLPQRRGVGVAQRVAVDLTPEAVERIADQVAKRLQDHSRDRQPELLSAGELARRLRVERPWIYRHRHLLGGIRIGAGPKAPWRFDYERAIEALRAIPTRRTRPASTAAPRRGNGVRASCAPRRTVIAPPSPSSPFARPMGMGKGPKQSVLSRAERLPTGANPRPEITPNLTHGWQLCRNLEKPPEPSRAS